VDNYKYRGEKRANLTWTGAASDSVDIIRDGSIVASTDNDGSYEDRTDLKGGGFNFWQVCEAGSTICSVEVTVGW
jgi:hypothetical protein